MAENETKTEEIAPIPGIPSSIEKKLDQLIRLQEKANLLLKGTENMFTGQKALMTANMEEILMDPQIETRSLVIKANSGNGGTIYVGKKGVKSTNSLGLAASQSVSFDHDHSKEPIYLLASSAGDGIQFVATW